MFRRKNNKFDETADSTPPETEAAVEDDIPPMPPLRRDGVNSDPKLNALLHADQTRRLPEVPMAASTQSSPTTPTPPTPPMSSMVNPMTSSSNLSGAATPVRRTPAVPSPIRSESSEKKLTVGREICLNGKITACDVLVVEGTVEAALGDSRLIEITESGVFKGSAEIDNAEIAGRFEGDLTVRGRLHVKSTGKVVGSVRYTRLEVEMGGEIIGDMKVSEAGQRIEDAAQ